MRGRNGNIICLPTLARINKSLKAWFSRHNFSMISGPRNRIYKYWHSDFCHLICDVTYRMQESSGNLTTQLLKHIFQHHECYLIRNYPSTPQSSALNSLILHKLIQVLNPKDSLEPRKEN